MQLSEPDQQRDHHNERDTAFFDRLVKQSLKPTHERLFVITEAGYQSLSLLRLRDSRPQDGLAIGSAVRAVVSANNRVVARRLNVLLRESRDQMHQRIEPVQAACRQKQQLEPQIAVLVMRQLVAENERRIRPEMCSSDKYSVGWINPASIGQSAAEDTRSGISRSITRSAHCSCKIVCRSVRSTGWDVPFRLRISR